MESRPVFADPSGRRHRALRLVGFGSMAVLAAFLVAVIMAVTGGPQAPFTQWAAPQAPSGARHGGNQALTGGNARSSGPTASGGNGGSNQAGAGGGTNPGGSATTSPSARPGSPSPSAGATPSPTASPTLTATASPTATHGRSGGHGNPHATSSPTPTA